MGGMKRLIAVALLACSNVHAGEMQQLTDDALADVVAQEGVQLTLRLRNNVDTANNPINCTGILNPCRMGIEFSGREGIWLMLKDYYGFLEINDIRLESGMLPSTSTGYQDPDRFLSLAGDCLITACDPRGLRAVRVSYPFNKGAGEYNDFNIFINIGRVALEFDNASNPLEPGYMRDAASGSVLGFRMSDSTALNAPSRSRFDGTAYVFGF
jgi:hypothetical protein